MFAGVKLLSRHDANTQNPSPDNCIYRLTQDAVRLLAPAHLGRTPLPLTFDDTIMLLTNESVLLADLSAQVQRSLVDHRASAEKGAKPWNTPMPPLSTCSFAPFDPPPPSPSPCLSATTTRKTFTHSDHRPNLPLLLAHVRPWRTAHGGCVFMFTPSPTSCGTVCPMYFSGWRGKSSAIILANKKEKESLVWRVDPENALAHVQNARDNHEELRRTIAAKRKAAANAAAEAPAPATEEDGMPAEQD